MISYFDKFTDIELSFRGNNGISRSFTIEDNLPVISGLPALQVDYNLQIPGGNWDFAILKPKQDLETQLGIKGLELDRTQRTYGIGLFTTSPEVLRLPAPHEEQINVDGHYEEPIDFYSGDYMELEVRSRSINNPGSSGRASIAKVGDDYYAYSLVYSNGSEILISEIINLINDIKQSNLVIQPDLYHKLLGNSLILSQLVIKETHAITDLPLALQPLFRGDRQNLIPEGMVKSLLLAKYQQTDVIKISRCMGKDEYESIMKANGKFTYSHNRNPIKWVTIGSTPVLNDIGDNNHNHMIVWNVNAINLQESLWSSEFANGDGGKNGWRWKYDESANLGIPSEIFKKFEKTVTLDSKLQWQVQKGSSGKWVKINNR